MLPAKPCPACQQSFHPKQQSIKFCSMRCKSNAQRVRPARPCEECGELFFPTTGSRKYCSNACRYQARRLTPEKFWLAVDKTSHPGGCWLWTGRVDRDGYGCMGNLHMSRYSYILH